MASPWTSPARRASRWCSPPLGPAMLKIAGELADGTNTWMVGPKTMEAHIVKRLTAAADAAGRPAPQVVGGYPIALTTKPDEARAEIAKNLVIYGQLPSYRAMLDREGVAGPADIAILGDENLLRGEIKRLEGRRRHPTSTPPS